MDKEIKVIVPKKLLSLSPSKTAENFEVYKPFFDDEIMDQDVYNVIGVTGAYGSGKSSIVDTYFCTGSNKKKTIKVSLGIPCNGEALGKNIIEQILYSRKSIINSYSNIHRIDYTIGDLLLKYFFISALIFIFLSILICAFIMKINYISFYYNWFLDVERCISLFPAFVIFFIFTIFYIIFIIFAFLFNYRFKIIYHDVEISIDNNGSISEYFDKYKSEIVRFFLMHPSIQFVIFEDIDRWSNIVDVKEILSRLKELNGIINNRKSRGNKLKFIIEVKDDLFENGEERTKYYKTVIPIIPYSSSISNRDLFIKKFESICNVEYNNRDIINNTVINISPSRKAIDYVCKITDNPREMCDIINEYLIILNNHVLNYNLTQSTYIDRFDEIFLLSALKVIYPVKYNNLLNERCALYDLIAGNVTVETINGDELNDYEKSIFTSGLIGLEYRRIIVSTYKSVLSYEDQATLDVLQSKLSNKTDFFRKIHDMDEVLNNLSINDFSYDSICNLDLFKFIIDRHSDIYLDIYLSDLTIIKIEFLIELCCERPYIFKDLIDQKNKINKLLDFIKQNYIDSSNRLHYVDGLEYILSSIMLCVDMNDIEDQNFFDKLMGCCKNGEIARILNSLDLNNNTTLYSYKLEIGKLNVTKEFNNLFLYMVDNKMYTNSNIPDVSYLFILLDLNNITYDKRFFLTALYKIKEINYHMYKYFINHLYLLELISLLDKEKIILNIISDIDDNIFDNHNKIIDSENVSFSFLKSFDEIHYSNLINKNKLVGKFNNIKVLINSNIENKDYVISTYLNNRGKDIFKGISLKNKKKELEIILNCNYISIEIYEFICINMKEQNLTINYINNNLQSEKVILLIKNEILKFNIDLNNRKLFEKIIKNDEISFDIKNKLILNNYESFLSSFEENELMNDYSDYLVSLSLNVQHLLILSRQGFSFCERNLINKLLWLLDLRDVIPNVDTGFINNILQYSDDEEHKIAVYLKYKDVLGNFKEAIENLNIDDFNKIIRKEIKTIDYSRNRLSLVELSIDNGIIKGEYHSSKRPKKITIKY